MMNTVKFCYTTKSEEDMQKMLNEKYPSCLSINMNGDYFIMHPEEFKKAIEMSGAGNEVFLEQKDG